MTIWGETATNIYLLHAWRDKVEFHDLKRVVACTAEAWGVYALIVEDAASGQTLLQELDRTECLPLYAIKPLGDKVVRATAVTPICEAGKVLLPASAGWLDDYLDELTTFPSSRHDDFVDATAHALRYLLTMGIPDVW